jgi:hypothetical protein
VEDLAVTGGVVDAASRQYRAQAWTGQPARTLEVQRGEGGPCATLPAGLGGTAQQPAYVVVDVVGAGPGGALPPLRVHLYHLGGTQFRIAGLERPEGAGPPRL